MAFNADPALVEVCKVIAADLDTAQEAFKIWSWAADNADQINAANAGEALGTFQRMAINETVLAIFRMYDNRKDVTSIKRATKMMGKLPLRDRGTFEAYVRSVGSVSKDLTKLLDAKLASFGSDAINNCRPAAIGVELERIQRRRHEHIAHQAASKTNMGLFEADISACVEWARRFIHMAHTCFGTHSEVHRITSPKQSLINICVKAKIIPDPYKI